jgi:hypothetical protein
VAVVPNTGPTMMLTPSAVTLRRAERDNPRTAIIQHLNKVGQRRACGGYGASRIYSILNSRCLTACSFLLYQVCFTEVNSSAELAVAIRAPSLWWLACGGCGARSSSPRARCDWEERGCWAPAVLRDSAERRRAAEVAGAKRRLLARVPQPGALMGQESC